MYEYGIYPAADERIFGKQCLALEENIPGIIKGDLFVDVDGSKIQKYSLDGAQIVVHNSIYTNDVYVKSDVDLAKYFS